MRLVSVAERVLDSMHHSEADLTPSDLRSGTRQLGKSASRRAAASVSRLRVSLPRPKLKV